MNKIPPRPKGRGFHFVEKRDNELKSDARAMLIAYGLLRGLPFKKLENSERKPEWYSFWLTKIMMAGVCATCKTQLTVLLQAGLITEKVYNFWKEQKNIENLIKGGELPNDTLQ